MRFRQLSAALIGMLGLAWGARADSGWVLTTADFKQQPVSVDGIDGSGVKVTLLESGTSAAVVGYDAFLQVERAAPGLKPQGRFSLWLASGDRLAGDPTGLKDEQLLWQNGAVGGLSVSLKQARAMVRVGKSMENLEPARAEDMVQMSNGDSAKGIVTDITGSQVKISSSGSDVVLPLDAIDWIQFAVAGGTVQKETRAFRVHCVDGSLLSVAAVESGADKIKLKIADGDFREMALSAVSSIEQLNGPVSWLSSRIPQAVVQVPYYGSNAWPTRMDQTVGGKPIQLGTHTYARGIGVHAYSKIEYALDASYEAFRTQYAIAQDERRQYADVTVRIKLDGKTVHERAHLRADELASVVMLDLPKEAKLLTLEVDYGAANDVQDRFNWIEPALLRKKPAAPPASAPTSDRSGTSIEK